MPLKDHIINRIKRKETEIQSHEAKIREAKIYLQALQDILKNITQDQTSPESAVSSDNILRPGSMTYKTYELLTKMGKPLHISEILKGIGEEPTKKASLVSCTG